MSNTAQSSAAKRIEALLDENSFVEIGKSVTARSTDFNLTEDKTPSDPDGRQDSFGWCHHRLWPD